MSVDDDDGTLWTVPQVMAYLDVGRSTVYAMLHRGELIRVRTGGRRTKVLRASVLAYRDRAVSAATPPHGIPLGGTWAGATWAPGTVGDLEDGDGPVGPPAGLEGTG